MLKKIALVTLFFICTAAVAQQKKLTVQDYIDTYQDLAVAEMERTGIPASITLAQGILESGNGNSRLAKEGNNHFGIKCKKNWTGNTIYEDDDELHECFRAYKTAKESYLDHSSFLMENTRYAFLFDLDSKDYKGWAKGLKQAGYATNPQYAEILIGLIERHELHLLDKKIKIKKPEDNLPPQPALDPLTHQENKLFKFNDIPAMRVAEGQNAISIGAAYNLRPGSLYRYNDLKEGSDLVPGSIIYLKPKHRKGSEPYHTVKEGETMYSISQLYGIKLKHLYKKNRMEPGKEPAVGEVIYMRRKRKTPPQLRKVGAETIVPVAKTDTLKDVPYIEKSPVTITMGKIVDTKPTDPKPVTIPAEPVTHDPQGSEVAGKEEKNVFVEKEGNKDYNVSIEEKNKELHIDKKQLDKVQYHTVQTGETLFAISRKYGKSVDQLKQLNKLKDYSLNVGQKLIINENYTEKQPDVENTNFYHEVQPGETLYAIAKKYNMTVDELKSLNNLTDNTLSKGTKLLVSKAAKPAPTKQPETVTTNIIYHTVQPGETLYAISRKYSVSVNEIKKLNNKNDDSISVGDKLRVK